MKKKQDDFVKFLKRMMMLVCPSKYKVKGRIALTDNIDRLTFYETLCYNASLRPTSEDVRQAFTELTGESFTWIILSKK